MRVVVVDWDLCFPANSGKRLRTLNLMLPLAARHEITFLTRARSDSDEAQRCAAHLASHGVRTEFLASPVARKEGLSYYARLAANLVCSDPFAVQAHRIGGFERRLREYAAAHRHDVWQVEWTPYAQMLAGVAGVRTLAVAHNVDTLIWERYEQSEPSAAKRAYIGLQRRKFERFEREAFAAAGRTVAVSEEDAQLLRGRMGVRRVDVVENGVDLERYGAVLRAPRPGEVLFLGSLDWRPNQDAIRVLCEEVFPRVRASAPAATLSVVGRNPPEWMRGLIAQTPGAMLHADVPDVLPHLATAAMLATPLRIGGGSRLKILEALAAATPVVSTAVGAEGLGLVPGREYALADSPAEMAEAIVAWVRDPEAAASSAELGRRSVRERFGWPMLAEKLEASWRAVAHGSAEDADRTPRAVAARGAKPPAEPSGEAMLGALR